MTRCSGAMTATCRGDETRVYRTSNGTVAMCDVCAAVARRMGMALYDVPEWVARAYARQLPGKWYGGDAA